MRVDVYCYSGRTRHERPVRFRLDDHEYMVEEVLDQWYGPEDVVFRSSPTTATSLRTQIGRSPGSQNEAKRVSRETLIKLSAFHKRSS